MGAGRAWENWIKEYIGLVNKDNNEEASLPPTEANRLNYLRNLLEAGLGAKTTLSEDNRRFELRIPAEVEVDFTAEEQRWTGRTVNISVWGMCIEVAQPPPSGSRVKINLDIGEETISLPADVMWSCGERRGSLPAGVGVRIDPKSPETRSLYRDFCHRKLRERIYDNVG